MQRTTAQLYSLFFILMTFAYSTQLADPDLSPRMIVLSCFTVLFGLICFIFYKKQNLIDGSKYLLNKISISASVLLLVSVLAASKSINPEDARFDLLRYIILFLFFITTTMLLAQTTDAFSMLSKAINFTIIPMIAFGVIQIIALYKMQTHNGEAFSINYNLSSFHFNKNSFSEYLALALPFLVYGLIYFKKTWRWFSLINLLLTVNAIVIMQTASVWIALASVLFLSLLLAYFRKKEVILAKLGIKQSVIVLSFVLLLAVSLFAGYKYSNDVSVLKKLDLASQYFAGEKLGDKVNVNSVFERLLLWKNSVAMIKDNPITGIGYDNWKIIFPKYGYAVADYLSYDTTKFTRPHNDFLQYWTETGLFGLLSFLGLFIFSIFSLIRVMKLNDDKIFYSSLLLLAGIITYGIIAFFGFTTERIFNMVLFYCLLSLTIINHVRFLKLKNEVEKTARYSFSATILAVVLVALPVFASVITVKAATSRMKCELLYKRTLKFQKDKNWQRMLAEAKKIDAESFPIDYNATPINWYKATAYYLTGDAVAALEEFKKAEMCTPWHVQVLNDIAVIYLNNKQYDLASAYLDKAQKVNPDFPDALFNRTILAFNSGNKLGSYQVIKAIMQKSRSTKYYEYLPVILTAVADSIYEAEKISPELLKSEVKFKNNVWLQALAAQADKSRLSFTDILKSEINKIEKN